MTQKKLTEEELQDMKAKSDREQQIRQARIRALDIQIAQMRAMIKLMSDTVNNPETIAEVHRILLKQYVNQMGLTKKESKL